MDLQELIDSGGNGYERKIGGIGLIRCPICKSENYALSVSNGICSWCGFDVNKVEEDENGSNKLD